jgi:hypothetical protein
MRNKDEPTAKRNKQDEKGRWTNTARLRKEDERSEIETDRMSKKDDQYR